MVDPNLIFDLGVNNGRDSTFYLAKGFRVIGVEANPGLCDALRDIKSHPNMTLLNVGVWTEPTAMPFYVNKSNDHWSSFDPNYGCREGTPFEVIEVRCVTIMDLLRDFGTPHYLKIDIEGADRIVLAQLRDISARPSYVSVEEYGVEAIDDLWAIGYEYFQIVAQRDKAAMIPPDPPREGRYVERQFSGTDSGLFGAELPPEDWLTYELARNRYIETIRRADNAYAGSEGDWFDIHAWHGKACS